MIGKMTERRESLTIENYAAIRDHLFDRIHKNGEQLKNDFPNILRRAIEAEAWTQFSDHEGMPFTNLVDWLLSTWPNGTGMEGRHTIDLNDALELTRKAAPDVHRALLEHARKANHKSDGNMRIAQSAFQKMSAHERSDFLTWAITLRS